MQGATKCGTDSQMTNCIMFAGGDTNYYTKYSNYYELTGDQINFTLFGLRIRLLFVNLIMRTFGVILHFFG